MPSISLLKISKIGLSLVYKIPQKKTPGMFTFFSPLSSTIWICIVAAYFLASLVLYILSILPHAKQKICQKKSKQSQAECEPEINFINSFWFTMASILQQGTDFMPRQIIRQWSVFKPDLYLLTFYQTQFSFYNKHLTGVLLHGSWQVLGGFSLF